MTDHTTIGIVALVALATVPGAAWGQLDGRVEAVTDGTVRLSFAARAGVCGWGDGMRVVSRTRQTDDWESDCEPGPVRVVIDRRAGETVDVTTYVGGRWRQRPDVTDLGTVGAAAAAGFFLAMTRTVDPDVAKDALGAAVLADSITIWPLLETLAMEEGRPTEVRKSAIFWIGQTPDEEAIDALHRIKDRVDGTLEEQTIFALSQHPSPRSTISLRSIAEDPREDLEIRKKAIFWLGQGHSDDGPVFLQSLFARLRDPDLKERILFSVSQHRVVGARWLLEVALDDDEPVELRKKALFWAGQSRQDVPGLLDLFDRVDESALREHLIFVYAQRRRDPAALDKLMDIAVNGPTRELRRKAIFWIGQSRDPRAVEFLARLIGP